MSDGTNVRWNQCQMEPLSDGTNARWNQCQMETMSDGTAARLESMSDGTDATWNQCQMEPVSDGTDGRWNQCLMEPSLQVCLYQNLDFITSKTATKISQKNYADYISLHGTSRTQLSVKKKSIHFEIRPHFVLSY